MQLKRAVATLCVVALTAAACDSGAEPPDEEAAPAASPSMPEGLVLTPTPVEIVTEPAEGWFEAACALPPEILERIRRGYVGERSPDILFVPREPNLIPSNHSGPQDFLQRVPLVFYGPGYIRKRGEITLDREATLADMAPTIAELIGFDFPDDRAGKPLHEVLVPEEERPQPPKLVLTVVWDGGGLNVLEAWPDEWPVLKELISRGTAIKDAIVGSSPSITPPAHTNMSTGTFPRQHGIPDIPLREGDTMTDSFKDKSAKYMRVPTLADMYDLSTGNVAKMGVFAFKAWHLGMLGHGALTEGADKDLAVLVPREAKFETNEDLYYMPDYVQGFPGLKAAIKRTDQADGELDGLWYSNDILDDASLVRDTPAWTEYQTVVLKELIAREEFGLDEVPDLFYTNYKQIDEIGHHYNMLREEMASAIRASDGALVELTRFLDQQVGRRSWVMIVTADHGSAPPPVAVNGWPIHGGTFQEDVARAFDMELEDFLVEARSTGFYLDEDALAEAGVTLEEIADFIVDYRLEENTYPSEELTGQFIERAREPIFAAAFPSDALGDVWRCNQERNA